MAAPLSAHAIVDIRCTHRISRRSGDSRCQLLAGHEGEHAVMFCDHGRRTVRRWSDRGWSVDVTDSFETLPWVRGLPVPAWASGS